MSAALSWPSPYRSAGESYKLTADYITSFLGLPAGTDPNNTLSCSQDFVVVGYTASADQNGINFLDVWSHLVARAMHCCNFMLCAWQREQHALSQDCGLALLWVSVLLRGGTASDSCFIRIGCLGQCRGWPARMNILDPRCMQNGGIEQHTC